MILATQTRSQTAAMGCKFFCLFKIISPKRYYRPADRILQLQSGLQ
jgi:hypothetical protein